MVGGRIWRANVTAVAYGAVYAVPPNEPAHDAAYEAPESDDPFDDVLRHDNEEGMWEVDSRVTS